MATAVWVGYPQGNIPMANGFGGTLAAPIWHDYMQTASGGYCGNFPTPTTPFVGTAFFGHYSASGSASTIPGTSNGPTTRRLPAPPAASALTTTRPCSPSRRRARRAPATTGTGNGNGNGTGKKTGNTGSPSGGGGIKKH